MTDTIFSPFDFKPEALVVDNGEYPTHRLPLSWIKTTPYIICCDGAADTFISKERTPDIILGDGDSISADNKSRESIPFLQIDEQESNDQTKAVNYLIQKGIKNIGIVGATGKREDHTLGNISLLIEYQRMGINAIMATDNGVFFPCKDEVCIKSYKGQQVSIFNISGSHFSSNNLVYPLPDRLDMWWQGTLNEAKENAFSIEAEGEYLIFLNY